VLHTILGLLSSLPPPVVYVAVGALVLAEAALFVGFVVPGETAVLVGGLLAATTGRISLPLLAVVVVLAAIVGDSIGYEVGRKAGPRLLETRLLRRRRTGLEAVRERLRTKGGVTVVAGRFTALMRAATPALCGMSRMPYRRFLAWNAAGALVWGVGMTTLGYVAGRSLPTVEHALGGASVVVLAVFAVVAVVAHRRLRRRGAAQTVAPEPLTPAAPRPQGAPWRSSATGHVPTS
jgi:membrane protein DedA with SNARE-associated domain